MLVADDEADVRAAYAQILEEPDPSGETVAFGGLRDKLFIATKLESVDGALLLACWKILKFIMEMTSQPHCTYSGALTLRTILPLKIGMASYIWRRSKSGVCKMKI